MSDRKPRELTVPTCSACGKAGKESSRLPKGWSKVAGKVVCPSCFDAAYVTRACTMAVNLPTGKDERADLLKAIREALAESAACANFLATEFYARDFRRKPDSAKLPPWERPYLYPETARFKIPSQARAALEQAVAGKYRNRRYELLWTGEASLPTYRYGVPYDVPAQAYRLEVQTGDGGAVCVAHVSFPGGRVALAMRGGPDWRRQAAQFRYLADNPDMRGSLSVMRKRTFPGSHRSGEAGNAAARPTTRIMVKIVGYFPKKEKLPDADAVAVLSTGTDSFLRLSVEGDGEPWLLNADRFRDDCYQHLRNLKRISDDRKPEARAASKGRRKADAAAMDNRVKKFADRQRSFLQMSASAVAEYCRRRKVGKLVYDDAVRSYFPSFAWHDWTMKLAEKLKSYNIIFEHRAASDPVTEKQPDPLAGAEAE